MKIIFEIYLILSILNFLPCIKHDLEEGNILLPMTGTKLNITLQGKKIGNKNYYTVPLKVGTPEKTFNVQLDTSVSTSWLPSVNCKNCKSATIFYNESESTTACNPSKEELELDDEDGDVEGYKIDDDFILNIYKLKGFSFVQVTELDDDFRDHFNGKLGLGYRGEFGKNFNFIDKLKKDKLISKRIFSINQINDKKGLLYIGDTSAKKYTFCNVTSGEDLDEIYKESWVCDLTHVGIFSNNDGISNKLEDYTIVSDGKVDFDSAYEYIAVPIHYKQIIDELLTKANLICETNEKEIKETKKKLKKLENEKNNNNKLIDKFNYEEISIVCKTSKRELSKKGLSISFVLQGNVYSIPIDTLFSSLEENGKMEMKVKYIDDDDAIWTFGYPFMNQFLMIFNMDENHVGIKRIKKTSLPVINITKEWTNWNEMTNNFFYKNFDLTSIIIIASILFCLLFIIVGFLVWKACKKSKDKKTQELVQEMNNINNSNEIIY